MHSTSTYALVECGMIDLWNAAGIGQSRTNGDFDRGNLQKTAGVFHTLDSRLREALIAFCWKNARKMKRICKEALEAQQASTREKEELKMPNKLQLAEDNYVNAMYYHAQYFSPCCWETIPVARCEYSTLLSKTAKLRAVKEQIHIRYWGLGWKEAHHPWSQKNHTFSADELFTHLLSVVIPLRLTKDVPTKPPIDLPEPPKLPVIGTKAVIELKTSAYSGQSDKIKERAEQRNRECEETGEMDMISEMQSTSEPNIDDSLQGFKIEMYFGYQDEFGNDLFNWYHGVVKEVVNKKQE